MQRSFVLEQIDKAAIRPTSDFQVPPKTPRVSLPDKQHTFTTWVLPDWFNSNSIQTNWSRHKNMYLCVLVINLICVKVCTRKCAHDYHNNGGSRWFMSGHTIVCLSGRRLVQYLLSAPLCGGDSAHHSSNGPIRREINNWGGKPPICGHREPQHLILNSGLNKDCRAVDYLSSTEWSGGKN